MTREAMRNKNEPWALLGFGSLFLAFFFPSVLTIAIFFFSSIVLIPWGINLIREYRTPWIKVACPWCGQTFEAEPQDDLLCHTFCRRQVILKDGQAYKLGEVPADIIS
ncbi:MAG: hypothetical protein C4589_10135 [Peptococcaceae bacterium]|nr:MAG: hypothetical protein C4589_10135 [Peptococcaceae bacterium]